MECWVAPCFQGCQDRQVHTNSTYVKITITGVGTLKQMIVKKQNKNRQK